MTSSTGPQSSSSLWASGKAIGRIESIDDPTRSNRVQVRLLGYEADQGLIPKESLEWIRVSSHDSQMSGAGSTHNYYVGASVIVETVGDQRYVSGAWAGYDSDSRNKGSTGADSGSNQKPDVPAQARGSGGNQGGASQGNARDETSKGTRNVSSAKEQFSAPSPEKIFEYVKNKAPFDKGKAAKFPDMKSIGLEQLAQGSEVLDVIKAMDGNASGAIKQAIELIKNLRRGGFGKAMDMLGAGNVMGAARDHATYFGNTMILEIIRALVYLRETNVWLHSFSSVEQFVATGDEVWNAPGSLIAEVLELNPIIYAAVLAATDRTVSASDRAQAEDAFAFVVSEHDEAVPLAFSNCLTRLVRLSADSNLLDGVQNREEATTVLYALAATCGVDKKVIDELLRQKRVSDPETVAQRTVDLNMFKGNMIAIGEIMSGQKNNTPLSGIVLKLAKKVVNEANKKFKD